ncbi:sugar phosphate isomerase/epimerase family protein [Paenibacillus xerothermodurans]|uniref:Sugar phosphate isomerase/epimerase n=1 Tax=Paenibacillus xerothermodurans TaxID=1977292 RepID=A0A2W1NDX7_PAEXE|nr:sugar phosphate isomerase/epimerase family protein [Paenibacillus xerothermodurans]PZE22919.1 sugar phosphate isomerase/epimerase [Paenibacillus xerothermodurans]
MLRGLTYAGVGAVESDEQFIQLAAKYGFQAVDLDPSNLVERLGLEGTNELLQQNGIVLGAIGLPVEWRTTDEEFRAGLVKLTKLAAAASVLGCTACCTYILPSTDHNPAHFMAVATRRLRICAQVLGAYNIRLALEFVGPHHLRSRWKHPFIWTPAQTLDWMAAIAERNVGLLYDAYHWYTNGLTISDIRQLRADQIVHVHINDAPAVPVHEVLDNGRVYPGEGVIDLAGFLQGLHSIGYEGVVAQEILTATQPTDATESLMQRSRAGFDKVFGAAGLGT